MKYKGGRQRMSPFFCTFSLMSIKILIFSVCCLIQVVSSCSKYHYAHPRQHIEQKRYYKSDTLVIRDFVLCNSYKIYKQKTIDVPVNADSVIAVFTLAIQKSGVLFTTISGGQNYCDTTFLSNRLLDVKKISDSTILALAEGLEHKVVLIPLIYIDNRTTPMRFAQKKNQIAVAGFYQRDVFLNMAFYIVCNGEIIYLKTGYFGAISSETMTPYSKPGKLLEQKHWDLLTKKILLNYLKRSK